MPAVCSAVLSAGECAARGNVSEKGGYHAYKGCLGKDRSSGR